MDETPFSVVVSTYARDDPGELGEALESIFEQTPLPDEVVVVEDGPVPDAISDTIESYRHAHQDIVVESLASNRGRGPARQAGIERSSHDLIAMLDADDVCARNRFERQLRFLRDNPEVDVVGSYLAEFKENPEKPHAIREVPTDPAEIRAWARQRSPLNQSTVMGRKAAFVEAGGYRDVDRMEDYGLWVRMLTDGMTLANIPEPLVHARAGKNMHARRGGIQYALEEIRLQREFVRLGFLGPPRAMINIVIRVPLRLVPNRFRGFVYTHLLRQRSQFSS